MATKRMVIALPASKPRNPVAVPAMTRRAGPHDKSRKSVRQHLRQRTLNSLADLLNGEKTEFDID